LIYLKIMTNGSIEKDSSDTSDSPSHGLKDALALPGVHVKDCVPLKATSGHRLYQPIF
jgi:hypothetical protein